MNLYQEHYKKTVLKDLSSRFLYFNCNQITKIEKISVNIGIKDFILKKHITNGLALEFITSKSPIVTKAKKNTVLLNLKKNSPNGFKLNIMTKNKIYIFFQKLVFYIFPNFKATKKFLIISKKDSLSFSIREIDSFKELTFFYSFFKNISFIDINIKLKNINNSTNNEALFFLTSFNLPILMTAKVT